MFRKWLSLFFLFGSLCGADYSIIFVHIGDSFPDYGQIALQQARKFNPNCPVILLASEEAIRPIVKNKQLSNITFIAYESVMKRKEHLRFEKDSRLNGKSRGGFWKYASERFLYLNDLMQRDNLQNVFHLEYDNLLYVNLEELLPTFSTHYPGIGAVFDNDNRSIPGFVFIANPQAMLSLASYFADCAKSGLNDMEVIAKFNTIYGPLGKIGHLPIIPREYAEQYPLITPTGFRAARNEPYFQHIDLFRSIFDGAAIGQYLGGIDPRNAESKPGFINESCIFNPSYFQFEWDLDPLGRKIPYAVFHGHRWRINNLHIHSKNLQQFRS